MKEMLDGINAIKDFTVQTKDFFTGISKVFHYITHPIELLKIIWDFIATFSGPITLLIFLIAMILFFCGFEKAKKYMSGSFFFHVIIQMFTATMK